MDDMSPSTRNYAYLDATDCLPVNSIAIVNGTGRTHVSGTDGYNGGFQSGMWQLAADCTTLSASWLNSDGITVPVMLAYDINNGFTALTGNKDAFQALQEVTLQLTPQGYVKVLRTGITATYYIAKTFSASGFLDITTTAAQAQVFAFTTGV
jgi:hypothetical protein